MLDITLETQIATQDEKPKMSGIVHNYLKLYHYYSSLIWIYCFPHLNETLLHSFTSSQVDVFASASYLNCCGFFQTKSPSYQNKKSYGCIASDNMSTDNKWKIIFHLRSPQSENWTDSLLRIHLTLAALYIHCKWQFFLTSPLKKKNVSVFHMLHSQRSHLFNILYKNFPLLFYLGKHVSLHQLHLPYSNVILVPHWYFRNYFQQSHKKYLRENA